VIEIVILNRLLSFLTLTSSLIARHDHRTAAINSYTEPFSQQYNTRSVTITRQNRENARETVQYPVHCRHTKLLQKISVHASRAGEQLADSSREVLFLAFWNFFTGLSTPIASGKFGQHISVINT